ncbi:MAG TPA: DUF2520 domain-containing protein [Sandaracinaceae bacterium]
MDARSGAPHLSPVSDGRIAIIGRGRLGRGLAHALREAGARVALFPARSTLPRPKRGEIAIVATPDPAIAATAARLAERVDRGAIVLHCSGSLRPDVLAPCKQAGAFVGAMHPLVSFADPVRPPDLRGTSFVIAGDRTARGAARRLASLVGARAVAKDVHGPAYHAAAALAANGAAALAAVSVRVMRSLGLGQREAERAIGALLRTVGENVARVGVPRALSGPIVRGDAATVRVHRAALAARDRPARDAYDAVAPAILECAIDAGLGSEQADAVRAALE